MKELKNSVLILFWITLIPSNILAQTIVIQQNNHNDKTIKLASHYGDNIFLQRELNSNETGKCVFYFDSLSSGIYYIILPDSSSFEFMYDSNYEGKITIQQDANNRLKVATAPEITLKYSEYTHKMESISFALDSVRIVLRQHDIKTKEKKKLLEHRDILHYRKDSLISAISLEYKGSLLGAYALAQQKIKVPEYVAPSSAVNKDSAIWAWRIEYYNKHFLDNLDISDERLIHTPLYTSMVNRYLDKITQQQPGTLKTAIDFLLNKAHPSTSANIFLSDYLLNKYNDLKNSALYEIAYLHIIENYYLKAESAWVSDKDMAILSREFNRRKPLELGQIAPNISLKSSRGHDTTLYAMGSEYTVLYFYNYDCELCQKTSPALKKILLKHNTDKVSVFAVCMGNEDKKSREYIIKNGFSEWVNVFDSEQINSIAVKYNLKYTPTIYLLDKNKSIIAKNLNIDQLKDYLDLNIVY